MPYLDSEYSNTPSTGACAYFVFDFVLQFQASKENVWINFNPVVRKLDEIMITIMDFLMKHNHPELNVLINKVSSIQGKKKPNSHVRTKDWMTNFEMITILELLNAGNGVSVLILRN